MNMHHRSYHDLCDTTTDWACLYKYANVDSHKNKTIKEHNINKTGTTDYIQKMTYATLMVCSLKGFIGTYKRSNVAWDIVKQNWAN